MQKVEVSIVCNTYNHEQYIRETMDSFLMQKTSFPFEILIHDDASTDKTVEILREYEEKYPDIIRPIYQTVNQYSQGADICQQFQSPRARGKYIALCEGDDYWTDPYKLQKQYDAMEAHPEVDICAHCTRMIDANTLELFKFIAPADHDCILPQAEVIVGDGGFVGTNSLFYRTELDFNVPKFREYFSFDYTLQMHGSLRGGMLYLKDTMSVYRFMTSASWTKAFSDDKERQRKYFTKVITALQMLDEETAGAYHIAVEDAICKNEIRLLKVEKRFKEIFNKKYKKALKAFPFGDRVKMRILAWFPWLDAWREKRRAK